MGTKNSLQASTAQIDEIPERLDEQHIITTKTLGFLIHPNIPTISPTLKIADIGTGSGAWLLDVAKFLPSTCQLIGYDLTLSALPPASFVPLNVSFKTQDMNLPFPASEMGTYDIINVRFVAVATTRTEWIHSVENLMTLLKPGGWIQWIESCNFSLYNSVPRISRAACQEIYDGLETFRDKEDVVIGMFMREPRNLKREEIWRSIGLMDVHEDVFSTDRLQDEGWRDKLTRNVIVCFVAVLENLIGVEGSGWTKERLDGLKERATKEIDQGVYHTLDDVCIIGRKA